MMKSLKQTLLAVTFGALGMSSLSLMASEIEKHVMIKIDKTDSHDTAINFNIDGATESFSLPELQPGESKVITTESGNNITVTKTDSGITLDVDGKSIQLPSFSGKLGAKIHRSAPLHQFHQNSIQISGVKLDENQKQIIQNAFSAAGIDQKIHFSEEKFVFFSEDSMGGNHEVRQIVIKDGDIDNEFEFESHSNANYQFIIHDDKKHQELHIDSDKKE